MIETAIVFATRAHAHQVDKAGLPYIYHPLRVMEAVRASGGTEAQITAAILHDVVEDTATPIEDIGEAFGQEVEDLVWAVTRSPELETYDEFIERLAGYPDAVLIKRCDIRDNLSRMNALEPDVAKRLKSRYMKALRVLATAVPSIKAERSHGRA